MKDSSHAVGLFRALVRLYPRAFRESFGEEMVEVFIMNWRENHMSGFLKEAGGAVKGAAREWIRSLVDRPVTPRSAIPRFAVLFVIASMAVNLLGLIAGPVTIRFGWPVFTREYVATTALHSVIYAATWFFIGALCARILHVRRPGIVGLAFALGILLRVVLVAVILPTAISSAFQNPLLGSSMKYSSLVVLDTLWSMLSIALLGLIVGVGFRHPFKALVAFVVGGVFELPIHVFIGPMIRLGSIGFTIVLYVIYAASSLVTGAALAWALTYRSTAPSGSSEVTASA